MDAPQPQRTKIHAAPTHDYITNLPPNVKEKILLKLPIKEVVRTSILSTKWIDAWVSIPNLDFEEYFTESELIKMVDMVLLGHQGPIQKFKLRDHRSGCNEAISRWLLVLSRNNIKDLELLFCEWLILEIPFHLIYCIVLERLSLRFCSINIPTFFQGFNQLRTLILFRCKLSGITLEKMISSCPMLDHFELCSFYQGCLHISAQNLTYLEIVDGFPDICLETPKLTSACIWLTTRKNNHDFSVARDRKESNIIHALGCLSNIQKLAIGGAFLQFMTTDQPITEASWESKNIEDCLFKHLKVVNIEYAFDSKFSLQITKSVLEFARLVLSTAPVLEKLNFLNLKDAVVIFEMKWFPKLSKNAEIAFFPYSNKVFLKM